MPYFPSVVLEDTGLLPTTSTLSFLIWLARVGDIKRLVVDAFNATLSSKWLAWCITRLVSHLTKSYDAFVQLSGL